MARSDIKIKVDKFLTATRLSECMNVDCRFNMAHIDKPFKADAGCNCKLKKIEINEKGQCQLFERYERR